MSLTSIEGDQVRGRPATFLESPTARTTKLDKGKPTIQEGVRAILALPFEGMTPEAALVERRRLMRELVPHRSQAKLRQPRQA